MSKYKKLENLKWHSPDESILKPLTEFYVTESDIADLPTIEVSEDAISRDYVRLIESDEDAYHGDWNETYERGFADAINKVLDAPSVIPTQNNAIQHVESVESVEKAKEGEWKWEMNDICHNCGYKIPHLERIVGETVLMDSKDWSFCPNCGSRR